MCSRSFHFSLSYTRARSHFLLAQKAKIAFFLSSRVVHNNWIECEHYADYKFRFDSESDRVKKRGVVEVWCCRLIRMRVGVQSNANYRLNSNISFRNSRNGNDFNVLPSISSQQFRFEIIKRFIIVIAERRQRQQLFFTKHIENQWAMSTDGKTKRCALKRLSSNEIHVNNVNTSHLCALPLHPRVIASTSQQTSNFNLFSCSSSIFINQWTL